MSIEDIFNSAATDSVQLPVAYTDHSGWFGAEVTHTATFTFHIQHNPPNVIITTDSPVWVSNGTKVITLSNGGADSESLAIPTGGFPPSQYDHAVNVSVNLLYESSSGALVQITPSWNTIVLEENYVTGDPLQSTLYLKTGSYTDNTTTTTNTTSTVVNYTTPVLSLISKTDTSVTLKATDIPSSISTVTFRQGGIDIFGIDLFAKTVNASVSNGTAIATMDGFTTAGNYTFTASYSYGGFLGIDQSTKTSNTLTVYLKGGFSWQNVFHNQIHYLTHSITVSGQVTNEAGVGISNATVVLSPMSGSGNPQTTTTDQYGNYSLTTDYTNFHLMFKASGFKQRDIDKSVPLISSGEPMTSHITQNVMLQPLSEPVYIQPVNPTPTPYYPSHPIGAGSATVQGKVTDSSTGLPIADVSVSTSNNLHTMTDSDGTYSMTQSYPWSKPSTVSFSADGYITRTVSTANIPNTGAGEFAHYVVNASLVPVNVQNIQPVYQKQNNDTSQNTVSSGSSKTSTNSTTTSTSTTSSGSTNYGMSTTGASTGGGGISSDLYSTTSSTSSTTPASGSSDKTMWIIGGIAVAGLVALLAFRKK